MYVIYYLQFTLINAANEQYLVLEIRSTSKIISYI
jgi:hypothetical protein